MARGELSGTNVFEKMRDSEGRLLWGGQRTQFDTESEEHPEYSSQWAYPSKGYNDWEALKALTSPSGTPEYVNRLSLRGTFRANRWLSFTAQPAYVYVLNSGNVSGETRKGFEIAFAADINIAGLFSSRPMSYNED